MYAPNDLRHLTTVQELEGREDRSQAVARHIPRRSMCLVKSVTVDSDGRLASFEQERRRPNDDAEARSNRPWISVSAFPAPDRTSRFHVFVEHGTRLKKLDLPSTARVMVSQPFNARVGDSLSFNYVALLYASLNEPVDRCSVRVMLVNVRAATAQMLVDRSIDQSSSTDNGRLVCRARDSRLFTITQSALYELRFVTSIDPRNVGSESQLLINSACVLDPAGNQLKELASLSCVGRVR
jgi:hypothetical protein